MTTDNDQPAGPQSYLQEDRDTRDREAHPRAGRVFVVQESTLDLVRATKFGELMPLLPGRLNITMSPAPVIRELKAKLKDFCDSDYLLPLGDPVAIGLAFTVAADQNRGRLRVLKWDKANGSYYVVSCNIHERG